MTKSSAANIIHLFPVKKAVQLIIAIKRTYAAMKKIRKTAPLCWGAGYVHEGVFHFNYNEDFFDPDPAFLAETHSRDGIVY